MNNTANKKLTNNAKELRKNMTKQERLLWLYFLKNLSVTVNRQKVIGRYIVDFYIASSKIAIELDGSQHYDVEGKQKDIERDINLKILGIKVLRYTNLDVERNFKDVCQDILNHLKTPYVCGGTPHQSPTAPASPLRGSKKEEIV